jgi:hypothetical protein
MKEDYAKLYAPFHENQKLFPGYTIERYVDIIAGLVKHHKPTSMLDYGCGKGYQYVGRRVHERWGGILPHCYDIGVRQLNEHPTGKFGAVVCTDVMEHIATPDIPEVLRDIFSFAEKGGFVFFGISCALSKNKAFPDGRNVHLTVQPPAWWEETISVRASEGIVVVTKYSDV